jgi:hypothetical protein
MLRKSLRIGLRRQAAAAGAEVPLQVADPQHQFGDGGGARVEFEAEELVRVDGQAFGFEALLAAPESVQLVEHFAFEALHVFERHVEEIAEPQAGSRTRIWHRRWWKASTSARAASSLPSLASSRAAAWTLRHSPRSGSMTVGSTRRST